MNRKVATRSSYDQPTPAAAKRPRGRPKGSKNKPKTASALPYDGKAVTPPLSIVRRKRGRPPGSGKKTTSTPSQPTVPSYDQSKALTPVEYGGLQTVYDHFNAVLFDGALPDVFITYQRRAHSRGYYAPDRFSARVGKFGRGELALNPDAFVERTDEQICSTVVHEMVHVWQHHHGDEPSRGYHNKQWAAKMKALGLQPTSTGAVGGRETGAQITHLIIPGGPYMQAFGKLAASGWRLNLQSAMCGGAKGGKNSKTKFTCSECGQKAWGKPELAITCELCNLTMLSTETTQDDAVGRTMENAMAA